MLARLETVPRFHRFAPEEAAGSGIAGESTPAPLSRSAVDGGEIDRIAREADERDVLRRNCQLVGARAMPVGVARR